MCVCVCVYFLVFWGTNQPTHGYCIIGFLEFIGRLTKYKTHCARAKNVINMRHIIMHNGHTFCVPHDIKSINVAAEQTTFRPIWDFAALSFTLKSALLLLLLLCLSFNQNRYPLDFDIIFNIILIMPFWNWAAFGAFFIAVALLLLGRFDSFNEFSHILDLKSWTAKTDNVPVCKWKKAHPDYLMR